jgi:hypothetical protein
MSKISRNVFARLTTLRKSLRVSIEGRPRKIFLSLTIKDHNSRPM